MSEKLDWGYLAPRGLHPTKVAICEALSWLERELSSIEMERMLDDPKTSLANISYHAKVLAEKGVLVIVKERQVRGAVEKFFYFAAVRPDRDLTTAR